MVKNTPRRRFAGRKGGVRKAAPVGLLKKSFAGHKDEQQDMGRDNQLKEAL